MLSPLSRPVAFAGLMAIAVFAGALLLSAAPAEASHRHHRTVKSGGGLSIGLHFGSRRTHVAKRMHLHHGHVHRHRLYGHSFYRPGRHRVIYHAPPRRRLLHRHYHYHGIVPPSSPVHVYGHAQPRVSSYAPPREAERRPTEQFRYPYRERVDAPPPRPEFRYPYADEVNVPRPGRTEEPADDWLGGTRDDAAPPAERGGDGWLLLRTGNAADARNVFAAQADREPDRPAAHLGYALAVAQTGDDEAAVRAMRQAMLIDPAALTALPIDHVLEHKLDELLDRFDPTADGVTTADAAFFRAALHTMLGEYEAARAAINASVTEGDAAAFALKGFLESLD